ncbi:MAG: hypothetical protein SF182_13900 [Deltaproteobacteria bacterium]|nr:hypothetical protein [Deltaproteobacteria bacterium]
MSRRIRPATVVTALLVVIAGCRFESTIDKTGGAELTVRLHALANQSLDRLAKDMTSAHVEVVSKAKDKDNWVTMTLKMKDVTKLSTTEFFSATNVTLTDDAKAGTKTLKAVVTNKNPADKLPDTVVEYYGKEITIIAKLPGEIVKSNATSTSGQTATWTTDLRKFFGTKQNTMEVTYKLAQ